MQDIITIAKKELRSFFTDKIILMQIILLPFAIVFGYSLLMSSMSSSIVEEASKVEKAFYVNAPEEFSKVFDELGIKSADISNIDKLKEDIKNKECNLLVVFPDNFISSMANSLGDTDKMPDVEIWYNSNNTASTGVYEKTKIVLAELQPKIFTVNRNEGKIKYNFGDELYEFRRMMSTIFPMMVFMAVFMVCMNLAANSIAGDKEKGFLNTMLITPVKRSSIATGKSVSLFVAAIIGSVSAFLGMALSLPKLAESVKIEKNMSYSASQYLQLFAVTITAIFVLTGILLIISALAKDVKQATTIAPIILMILVVGTMLTMNESFSELIDSLGTVNYIIPAWNSMILMQKILQMDYSVVSVIVTCLSNVVFTAITIYILSVLFKNEKIVNG